MRKDLLKGQQAAPRANRLFPLTSFPNALQFRPTTDPAERPVPRSDRLGPGMRGDIGGSAMPSPAEEQNPDQRAEPAIPLAAEELAVAKQVVETGRVRVARVTHEREQLIDETLARETAEISRVPIGRQIETMPAVREEEGVTIIPVVEEVLVVERRLFLKEELRIRRVRTTEQHRESVTLRYQEAVVTRLPVAAPEGGEIPEDGARMRHSNEERGS
jgi:uncharacterized protein (TIGR02271 family)